MIKIKGATSPVPDKQFEVSLVANSDKFVDIKVRVGTGYDYFVLRLLEEDGKLLVQRIAGLPAADFKIVGAGVTSIQVKESF